MTTTSLEDPDRRFWLAATAVAGGAGLIATVVPFVASLAPSERARAIGAPVGVDLQGMEEGKLRTVEWRGQPVFVLRRSADMLESLQKHDELLADPQSKQSDQPSYAENVDRSIRPEYIVMVGLCTHLGCIPTFRPTPGVADIGASWPGGFYCPCHGSKFDLAGRVFKDVPAPTNLVIPSYHFASDTSLLIGVDPTPRTKGMG
ncbi:MAG TPA: ubiquinol-cytochrome c reductase iron-sulfur subunit [Candidatus Accumulibacter phosphatis]|nr:ubiquinol-cytochrome c reductase iron-sulfur subunit [Candidatus Accumulibacter phosphatis]